MFAFLPILVAQLPPSVAPQQVLQPQQVRPLTGSLDAVPMFNSNSPEHVQTEGILLSTFPCTGKKVSTAHLNYAFRGRFDVFAHHVAEASSPQDSRTLYVGILLHNPGLKPVTIDVLQAATYVSQPDAPFIALPPQIDNQDGKVFAGPGDRVMNDVLRGQRQAGFPDKLVIPPGQSQLLLNLPIPVKTLTPPLNGRSTFARLRSNGKVYAASLAMYARANADGSERAPTLAEWQNLLDTGDLVKPRDRAPTPLDQPNTSIIYGRVAGVSLGSEWRSLLVDRPQSKYLTIPAPGLAFSYGISTLHGGTLGTEQIQSARMLVRYPDTAYRAHGNYGVEYSLKFPLYNNTQNSQTVTLALQTPLKERSRSGLEFLNPPGREVFFRGTVRLSYQDDQGQPQTRFIHLVQKRGEMGAPLASLKIKPGTQRLLEVDLLYPPDATPPQVLTIKTLDN